MKLPVIVRASSLLLLFALGLTGCGKPDEPPAETRADAMPSPTATPVQDAVTTASEKLKHRTDKAIASLTGFLHNEDPRIQAKLQRAADKVLHNKDKWRKQIQDKIGNLQPQIEQLKEQAAKVEGKSKDDVNRQLAALQAESQKAGKTLVELENASGDAWKKLKADMKDAEAKEDSKRDKADASPTP